MGRVKDQLMDEEEARHMRWEDHASRNNMRCGVCGELIAEDDESNYHASGMCGECAYRSYKED